MSSYSVELYWDRWDEEYADRWEARLPRGDGEKRGCSTDSWSYKLSVESNPSLNVSISSVLW
jgi:hypothetical protein